MGYTHYWTSHTNLKQHPKFKQVIKDMAKIIEHCPHLLAGPLGEGNPIIEVDYIGFNGKDEKDEAYETFAFDESPDFHFCKTAHRPYDIVVTACLSIAKDLLKQTIKISSNGKEKEWEDGVHLASKVLGRIIRNPLREEE